MKTANLQVEKRITNRADKVLKQLNMIVSGHSGKCLSSGYENIKQKLLWECKQGHRWSSSVNSILYAHSWCPYCAGNRKLTLTELRQIAARKGGKCLATHYVNSKTKLLWQCKYGHQWYASAFSIKTRESWCPVCYRTYLKT